MATQSKFAAWVHTYSVSKLATTLRVSKVAVYKWVNGQTSPRVGTMLKIQTLSKGKIKPQDVLAVRSKTYLRSPAAKASEAKAQPALKAASHKKLKAVSKTKLNPSAKSAKVASRVKKKTASSPKKSKVSK